MPSFFGTPAFPVASASRPAVRRIAPLLESLHGHAERRSWASVQEQARRLAGAGSPAEARGPAAVVEREAGVLASLGRLMGLTAGPWEKVAAAQVKKDLGALTGPAADPVRRYLGVRARLEGHAELAGELGTAKADAPALLRDLKRAAASPPPEAPGSPLAGLAPEGTPLGFRPAVREALAAGLPALEEIAKAEAEARKAARGELAAAGQTHWPQLHLNLSRLNDLRAPRGEAPAVARAEEDELKKHLGRPLDAAEREMARYLRTSMTAEEVAEAIKEAGR